jgi:hypothetical protein
MALGSSGTALPLSGVGNINNVFGQANSSAASMPPFSSPQQAAPGAVAGQNVQQQPMMQQQAIAPRPQAPNPLPGNIGTALPQMQQPQPQMQRPGQPNFSQLHPQVTQALKNLPPGVLQQLHNSGMIHPGLMQHVTGSH